jgi:hypothetical protein
MLLPNTDEVQDRANGALHWISNHTGVPIVVVAALAIVITWKVFKAGLHLIVSVAIVTAALVVATNLGWVRF